MNWLHARYSNCFPEGLPTFTSSTNSSTRTTLDYVYILSSEQATIRHQQIHHLLSTWTDHSLLSFDIALDQVDIGSGAPERHHLFESQDLARLNITPPVPRLPLEDGTSRSPPSVAEVGLRWETWECLKRLLRQVAQSATRLSSSRAKYQVSRLQQQRQTLFRQLSTASPTTAHTGLRNLLTRLDSQIEQLLEKETAQYRLRTATQWHEAGERNNNYFHRSLKARHNSQIIHGLRDSATGELRLDVDGMLREATLFYTDLCGPDPIDQTAVDTLLAAIPSDVGLSVKEQNLLVDPPTVDELQALLQR
ncbi:hypothetical protein A0J61_11575, partial [Choanephora cucurbitarum]